MSGIKKKPNQTGKNTKSPSKKQSKYLKTPIGSKGTTKETVPKKKSGGKLLDKAKKDASSLSSTWTLKQVELESSALASLQSVKKRSIADQKSGGSGWVRANSKENEGFKLLTENLRIAKGRPRRDPSEISHVSALRLTTTELALIEKKAKEAGFQRWREWARKILLGELKNAS
jgi:hypothetical protein